MVHNAFLAGWSAKQFQATVLNDVWPELTFFTLVATMVSLVSKLTPHSLAISNQMLTVLGTVLGLVVSFRTSSAYERYVEGRRLWTNIGLASRNLAQLIWIHVSVERPDEPAPVPGEKDAPGGAARSAGGTARLKAMIEKKTMINLIHAFSVSVKHMLRGEPGIYYEDLYPLVCFLPRYAEPPAAGGRGAADVLALWDDGGACGAQDARSSEKAGSQPDADLEALPRTASPEAMAATDADMHAHAHAHGGGHGRRPKPRFRPESVLPVVAADRALRPARSPPKTTVYDYLPVLLLFRPLIWLARTALAAATRRPHAAPRVADDSGRGATGRRRPPAAVESAVPLEIALFLSGYLEWVLRANHAAPAVATALLNNLGALQDAVLNLDRVRGTPIPFAYQAHLRMTIWLYCFFLPFQIYDAFGYLTIPATAFGSFLLLGFLEIGQEIENPFNYDLNDLDLDAFCLALQRELHEIAAHPAPDPASYVFSPHNQPFAPADRRSAQEIVRDAAHAYHAAGGRGAASVRGTLLRSWRAVRDGTRE